MAFMLPFRNGTFGSFAHGASMALAYAIFLSSGFNYAAMSWVNQHSWPAMVTAFLLLQVVTTAIPDWFFLAEAPSTVEVGDGSLIIVGLLCVTVSSHPSVKIAEAPLAELDQAAAERDQQADGIWRHTA